MNIRPETLLDRERIRNGPMVVFWGQEAEEYWTRPEPINFGEVPGRKLRHLLRRQAPWRFTIRLAPGPAEESLSIFGERVAMRFGQHLRDTPDAGKHRAIWQSGVAFAATAPDAVGCVARMLPALEGISVSAVQIRVERWAAA